MSSPGLATNHESVTQLRGVKGATEARLAILGIRNLYDLIFHFPFRYQDRTHLTPIAHITHDKEALIQGKIVESKMLFYGKKGLQLTIADKSGYITIRFFYHSFALRKTMTPGKELRCYGLARYGKQGMAMVHPECSLVGPNQPLDSGLTPVYPLTQGISQRKMREIIAMALTKLRGHSLPELIDGNINLPGGGDQYSVMEALKLLHSPPADVDMDLLMNGTHPAQYKLALEELCAHRVYLLREKLASHGNRAPQLSPQPQKWLELERSLPFTPTAGQQEAFSVIAKELNKEEQMIRLLQGDVGCGKTLVAAYAASQAATNGWQVAILAPTEILAEQHINQFTEWFMPLGMTIVPLVGKMSASEKKKQYKIIESGDADLVIGTHALFQEKVVFSKLGLIIVDEQQRFGVKQRQQMQDKGMSKDIGGVYPHQLIMSATPIPRTLAQTILANMDMISIRDMPPGRIPCKTSLLHNSKRAQLAKRLEEQLKQGAQIYWVCPLIEESDVIPAENVKDVEKQLRLLLPDWTIATAHGRQKSADKSQAMMDFKQGKSQILVATTVIEVGVDVPQANFMVIENAERLGLSQLHQLRGRVGRGGEASYCILLYNEPLSETAKERLQIMSKSNSGFEIAEADLRLRGAGEIIGTRQSGAMQFKVMDLYKHKDIISQSQVISERMLDMPADKQQALISRWINEEETYGTV